MIEFFIELTGDTQSFRLQTDIFSWREITIRDLTDNDFRTSDIYEIIRLQEVESRININGVTWELNSSEHILGETDSLDYEVYVKRTFFPLTPTRQQLVSTLEQGDDRISNALILNVYGFFELRPRETISSTIKDPSIIFRYETFDAGNEYVGREAAEHTEFVDELFAGALSYWLEHLQNGKVNYYSDARTLETIPELLQRIQLKRQEFEEAEDNL